MIFITNSVTSSIVLESVKPQMSLAYKLLKAAAVNGNNGHWKISCGLCLFGDVHEVLFSRDVCKYSTYLSNFDSYSLNEYNISNKHTITTHIPDRIKYNFCNISSSMCLVTCLSRLADICTLWDEVGFLID